MVCVTLQELTVTCNVSGDNRWKITSLSRWTAIINNRQSSARTHTLPHCTQLLMASTWLGDLQERPSAPKNSYTSYIWRVIKFYLLYLLTYLLTLLSLHENDSHELQYVLNLLLLIWHSDRSFIMPPCQWEIKPPTVSITKETYMLFLILSHFGISYTLFSFLFNIFRSFAYYIPLLTSRLCSLPTHIYTEFR